MSMLRVLAAFVAGMIALRRVLAFAVDWLVVALWAGALFGIVMLAGGSEPPRPADAWTAQMIGFFAMTLPVTLYFTVCEASPMQATVGKHALALRVLAESGERLPFGAALLRNAAKFAPWEFGHTVAQQAAYSGAGGFPAWVWIPAAVAAAGPVWWLASLFRSGRTPYDRWAGARVVRTGVEPA